jgi:hypothetical protein
MWQPVSTFLYPDAINIARCATKPPEAAMPHPPVIGEWSLTLTIETDLKRLGSVHRFDTAPVGDSTAASILLERPNRALLEPLAAFKCTITPG